MANIEAFRAALKDFYNNCYTDMLGFYNCLLKISQMRREYIREQTIAITKPHFVTYCKKPCSICTDKLVGLISSCPKCKQRLHTHCLQTQLDKGINNCPYCRHDFYDIKKDTSEMANLYNREEVSEDHIYVIDFDKLFNRLVQELEGTAPKRTKKHLFKGERKHINGFYSWGHKKLCLPAAFERIKAGQIKASDILKPGEDCED